MLSTGAGLPDSDTNPQLMTQSSLALYVLRSRVKTKSTQMNAQDTTTNIDNQRQTQIPDQFVAWIGFDWGHHSHAFAIQDQSGQRQCGTIPATSEALHNWVGQLQNRFGSRPVALAIETNRSGAISALQDFYWLTIYTVNPSSSASFRKTFKPSGASDDIPDAQILLQLLLSHQDKLRPLIQQDPLTIKLDALTRTRRQLVDHTTKLTCQITSLLRGYFPQALEMFGDIDSPLAIDFLSRWPDLISLKAAKPGSLKRFYYTHNVRNNQLIQKRLESVKQALALTTNQAIVSPSVIKLKAMLGVLRELRKQITILDREIAIAFHQHPNAHLFRNLPGAGDALAPRLCALFGTVQELIPDAPTLQKKIGVAPVLEKSGKSAWTHWRWFAPVFMRQTMIEWAGQTVQYSRWARVYYRRMAAQGKDHWVILRALAFKWIRVLWKCWATNTIYDEPKYLRQLHRRKSPNAVYDQE